MHILIKNYEFSDDRSSVWVDVDVLDQPDTPSATARFSFSLSVDPDFSLREIDQAALDELQKFSSEVSRHLHFKQALQ